MTSHSSSDTTRAAAPPGGGRAVGGLPAEPVVLAAQSARRAHACVPACSSALSTTVGLHVFSLSRRSRPSPAAGIPCGAPQPASAAISWLAWVSPKILRRRSIRNDQHSVMFRRVGGHGVEGSMGPSPLLKNRYGAFIQL